MPARSMTREELLQAAGLLLVAARQLDSPPVDWHDWIHSVQAQRLAQAPPYDNPLLLVRALVSEVLRGAMVSDGAGVEVTPVAQDLSDILATAEVDAHVWAPTADLYSGIDRDTLADILRDSGTSALSEALALASDAYLQHYPQRQSIPPAPVAPEVHEATVLPFPVGRSAARSAAGRPPQHSRRPGR